MEFNERRETLLSPPRPAIEGTVSLPSRLFHDVVDQATDDYNGSC
jgi:hypothetical protein